MIRCIAVDDETLALDLLEDNIKRVPFLELVGRCKNAYEAMELMQKEAIDLVFLDIQMPGITGTQFLQSLQVKPMVVFITAYKQYALQGFDLDVMDYLVKPVAFDRFLKAAIKAMEFYGLKNKPHPAGSAINYIFVSSEYNLVKININDISHVEGLKDYVKIHLVSSERPVITRLSMKSIEEKLPTDRYIRVHKSFIVSVEKINSVRKNKIRVDSKEIPVSDHYRENLLKIIDKGSIQ